MINPIKLFIKHCFLSSIILLIFMRSGSAQPTKSAAVFQLRNKKYISIQPCNDKIFRIRISDEAYFPETLMERYGIIKTDWNAVHFTTRKEEGNQIINTSGFQFIVNESTGNFSVKDSIGNKVISDVSNYAESNNPFCVNLTQSILQYFEGKTKSGEIIGDSNSTKKTWDSLEIGSSFATSILQVALDKDERFYGGGSTSRENIQHRGSALRMWATYQKTEVPMPFIMSSKRWGIFNNTTSLNYFDIGRFQKDKLFICNTDGNIDFYMMLGNSMEEVINLYTTITGKPYLLPKWAYGLAFGGNKMEDQIDVMNDAVRFRDEKIPCDIFWLEPQWMAKYYDFSTSKKWNLDKFPAESFWEVNNVSKYENQELFISKLHNLGFKLALWLCVDHDLSIEEEDLIAKNEGKPQSGQEHWFAHLTKFMDQGVDGFKLDPGRTLDEHPDRKYYNGYTDKQMHNLNQVLLPMQMNKTFREHKGIRPFQHYCAGYAGSQHWGAANSGDNGGGKTALFDQLNLGLCGFMNTSADVMESISDNRAGIHFGFFLPWVQVNSWYGLLHPWFLKPIEKETFRFYAQLRNSLSPYIYSAAILGSQTGMPILRAMPLIFPDDRKVDNMIYQFMFGDNLLVGVFSDSIYLPKGNWIDYWSGEKFSGGKTVKCKIPENRGGPLFIKTGAIIPYQKPMQYIGEFPVDTLILNIYPENKSSYSLLEDDGTTFNYENGEIATTKFNCNASSDHLEFLINPTQGSYGKMSHNRVYELEISWPNKPKDVIINGQITKSWNYVGKKIRLQLKSKYTESELIVVDSEK